MQTEEPPSAIHQIKLTNIMHSKSLGAEDILHHSICLKISKHHQMNNEGIYLFKPKYKFREHCVDILVT